MKASDILLHVLFISAFSLGVIGILRQPITAPPAAGQRFAVTGELTVNGQPATIRGVVTVRPD